ncbi:hypothetical protein PZH32_10110 [Adlercreutzia equolifaciens]|uniref:hypothetical protein n=1 Tax=Adlercreutzia equolifaciens TaxID=446660 RepID=UPI0023AFEF20|nr:hypothetical protein [Adlercreutzia equolifaciens]MDE8703310.1 hypothetical protein [Adlercreutzia equolifaciens]
MDIIVHPRVLQRHPDLSEADVLSAWENMISFLPRLESSPMRYIAIGSDPRGRLIEMVAQKASDGTWVIFHAMTPPSKKTLIELKFVRR